MKLIPRIVPLSAALLASACAAPSGVTRQLPPGHPAITSESVMAHDLKDRSEAYYHFMTGLMEERKGRYDEAIKSYAAAAGKDDRLIQAYERSASLQLRVGRFEEAIEMAEDGLEIDSNYVPLLAILGGIYSSLNNNEKTIEYFSRIIELEPQRKDVWIYLAVAHINAGGSAAGLDVLKRYNELYPGDAMGLYYEGRAFTLLKKWDDAERDFNRLIELYPPFAKGYEGLAAMHRARKQFGKAVEVYKKLLEVRPFDEEAKAKLAETYLLQESFDKAVDEYEELVKKEPEDMDLHFMLGVSHMRRAEISGRQEDYEKSLAEFQLVRASDKENPRAAYYIATIFERLNLVEEAIETWKMLLDHGQNRRDIFIKIAELYQQKGDIEKSLKYGSEALAEDPDEPELHFFIGLLNTRLRHEAEAVESFNKAISLNPADEKYYFYLGVAYEKLRLYDKCIESMKKVLEINPKHANAMNYLGYIYADKNINLDRAEEHLLQALEIEPDNGYFIDSLGWLYYRQGRYGEALEQMLTAVRNIPPDPIVLEHLGDVYAAMNDYEAAADAYERSLQAEPEDARDIDRETVREKLSGARERMKGMEAPK